MMMHEERAKLLASQLWHSEACEPSQLIQPLTAALQAVEHETWERAATVLERSMNPLAKTLVMREDIIDYYRQQAKEGQP